MQDQEGEAFKGIFIFNLYFFFFNFHCVIAIPDFSSHWTGLIEIIIQNFPEVEKEKRSGEHDLLIACVVAHQKHFLQCIHTT